VSARESAIAALVTRVQASVAGRVPPPAFARSETVPQRIPPGGIVVVRDGETVEETPILSPLSYAVRHVAEVEIIVSGATPSARAALLDALLMDVAAGIVAHRTLSGAVEWAEPGAPDFEDVTFEGASAARSALVPVSLFFTVAATPLS
jgi:hypothetical protein